jgi:F0F1-type ATP synthase membrane subunit b/b'
MLKLKVTKEEWEKFSKEIQAEYKVGGDGNYHLESEPDPDAKRKLEEFRENNVKLLKELKALQEQYKDVDPAKYKEYAEKIQKLEDKKMLEDGDIDKLVEQKTERMKKSYEDQIEALKKAQDNLSGEIKKTKERLSSVLIDSEITRVVAGKVRKGAMDDVLARARKVWSLDENGKPIPKEGEKILYGKDGKQHLTMDEYGQILQETAPFLFESSGGSGSQGNRDKGSGKMSNEDLAKLPANERLRMAHEQGDKK